MFKLSAADVEGRAIAARPSACLLAAVALLCVVLPASAAAQPVKPVLITTNPASPSTERRPYIQGDPDGGVITSAVGGHVSRGLGPIARGVNPGYEVTIYADDATCTEPTAIAAEGTAAELEGEGIQVDEDVQLGVETNFYATQTDPSDPTNPSQCSDGIGYLQVDGPPAAPSFTGVEPPSASNDNFPNLIGEATPVQATVSIYSNASCSGEPLGEGPASAFANAGIEVRVADNSTTTFYARSKLAGYSSTCSTSSFTYQEVTPAEEPGGGTPVGETPSGGSPGGGPAGGTNPGGKVPDPKGRPPAPTLRTVPGYAANDNTPTVTGKAPGAGVVQIYGSAGCKGPVLAEGSASQFTGAGLIVQVANDTVVTFYGISIDGGGDRSLCNSEPAVYIEDSTAPHTRITSGPAAKTRKRKVVFRFADIAGESATTFLCKLDRDKWKPCRAPLKLKRLGLRRHVLKVKAVDAAGNEEQGMAQRRFRVVRNY
jgi:hypothetical protein